jgi:MSHA pilin protein MshA
MNTKGRKREQGFTLIEIIAVLVILGILAAVAVPKFIGMQVDARKKVITGIQAGMMGAAAMVNSKAAFSGNNTAATGTLTLDDDTTINLAYGFPSTGADLNASMSMLEGVTISGDAFQLTEAPTPAECQVLYAAPESQGEQPSFTLTDTCE